MIDLIDIKETKVYQEAFEEGKEEGKLEGMLNGIEIVLDNKFGIEEGFDSCLIYAK